MTTTPSVVDRMVRAVASEDVEGLMAVYAPDAVMSHPLMGPGEHGIDEIRAGEEALFAAFDDIRPDVQAVVASGDRVAIELVMHATNTGPLDLGSGDPVPATGRRIQLPAVWMLRLNEEGLVVEEHDYLDTATLMAQLGLTDQQEGVTA